MAGTHELAEFNNHAVVFFMFFSKNITHVLLKSNIAFILYNTPEYSEKVQVVVKDETLWMTQKAMAQLFGVQTPAISKHLKNIFESGELQEEVVISKMETTTQHGAISGKTQTTETNFYHLDAIIAVGYRVNSLQATRFRQWATKILPNKGRISKAQAEEKAEQEYEIFNKTQLIESDFDKEVKRLLDNQ